MRKHNIKIKEIDKDEYSKSDTQLNNFFEIMMQKNNFKITYASHDEGGVFHYTLKNDFFEVVLHNAYDEFRLFANLKKRWNKEGDCPICSWKLPKNHKSFNELIKTMNNLEGK